MPKTRTLNLFGEVNESMAREVLAAVSKRPKTLEVFLNSSGGTVGDGLAIYDLLREVPTVIVKATGFCASAALLILAGGKYRLATETTSFMFHHAHADAVASTPEEKEEDSRVCAHLDGQVEAVLTEAIGPVNFKTLSALTIIDSKIAVKLGLIHGIEFRGKVIK
jgi:ATP-dependent Clp protease, protease subunit